MSQAGTWRDGVTVIGRALAYVAPFKWRFVAKALFNLVSLVTVLYTPWPLKMLLDHVVIGRPIDAAAIAGYPGYFQPLVRLMTGWPADQIALAVVLLGAATVLTLGVFGAGPAAQHTTDAPLGEGEDTATRSENQANWAMSFASGLYGLIDFHWQLRLSQALNHYYRATLFEKVQSLPLASLTQRRTGDLIYRVMYDAPMITRLVYDVLFIPVSLAAFVVMGWIVLSSYGGAPEVVIAAAAVLPVFFLVTLPFAGLLRRRSTDSREAGAVTAGAIEEGMGHILAVQSLGGWARERARFEAASADSFRQFRRLAAGAIMVALASDFAGQILLLLPWSIVAGRIISGQFTVGDYGVLAFYFAWMVGAAGIISQVWIRGQDNIAGLKRVFELMDMQPEGAGGTEEAPPIRQGIRVEGAGLVYPDGRRALEGVDFEAKVGEVTAIVGPTGAGKTSLAFLLPAYLSPTEGIVRIDGGDARRFTLASLRRQMAYVFQDAQLFAGTIADNIRYSRPEASMAEVEAAARTAGAHGFIAALPEGYETRLGGRGGELSVGQKQRISIARGLLQDARVLILDEPTSALDPETETALVRALREAASGRAVVIIAHRLSTIAGADRLVVLDEGRVIEAGAPAELLAAGGAYARMVGR